MKLLQSVAVQWLIRRVPEVAGIVAAAVSFFQAMPPDVQAILLSVLSGNGGGLTIGAYLGLASWVYAQVISYRKTTQSQIVQKVDGQAVSVPLKEVAPSNVERVAAAPAPRKTLVDILLGK